MTVSHRDRSRASGTTEHSDWSSVPSYWLLMTSSKDSVPVMFSLSSNVFDVDRSDVLGKMSE